MPDWKNVRRTCTAFQHLNLRSKSQFFACNLPVLTQKRSESVGYTLECNILLSSFKQILAWKHQEDAYHLRKQLVLWPWCLTSWPDSVEKLYSIHYKRLFCLDKLLFIYLKVSLCIVNLKMPLRPRSNLTLPLDSSTSVQLYLIYIWQSQLA